MSARDILDAIRRHHSGAAIVPEVTIEDDYWLDYWKVGEPAGTTRRIDALMWKSRQITAIEVKVTRADFDRETWRKTLPWQRVAHRFVYATPAGLLADRAIPHGCGHWEIHEDGTLTVARKAQVNSTPEPLPLSVVQCLAYRASRSGCQP